jgi:hypothetical protein
MTHEIRKQQAGGSIRSKRQRAPRVGRAKLAPEADSVRLLRIREGDVASDYECVYAHTGLVSQKSVEYLMFQIAACSRIRRFRNYSSVITGNEGALLRVLESRGEAQTSLKNPHHNS